MFVLDGGLHNGDFVEKNIFACPLCCGTNKCLEFSAIGDVTSFYLIQHIVGKRHQVIRAVTRVL